MSRRAGEGGRRSRDQTGEEGDITTVWEKTGKVCVTELLKPTLFVFSSQAIL